MDSRSFITKIEKIISENSPKSESAFNLLEIAHINRDEVKICRILHSMIDPRGEHGKGKQFFKIFANDVLGLKDDEIDDPEVTREERTDNNRRADLFIKTAKWLIPIEVKIDAEDQYKQCYDYYTNAKKNAGHKNVRAFYLTKDGKHPAEWSSDKLSVGDKNADTNIRCISFKEDICAFIDRCLNDFQLSDRLRVSFEILRDAIKGFCEFETNNTTAKIIDLIIESKETFNAAVQLAADNRIVSDCLDIIRRDLIKRYFDKVQKELGGEWNTYKESEIFKQVYTCGDYQLSVYFVIYPEKHWFDKKEWKGRPVVGVQIWKDDKKMLNDELKGLRNKLENDLSIELLSSFKYNWICRKLVSDDYDFWNLGAENNKIYELIKDEETLNSFAKTTADYIKELANTIG